MALTQEGLEKIAGYLKETLTPDGDYICMTVEDGSSDVEAVKTDVTFNSVVSGPPVKVTMDLSTNTKSIYSLSPGETLKYMRLYRSASGLPSVDGTMLINMVRGSELTYTNGGRVKLNSFEIEITEV